MANIAFDDDGDDEIARAHHHDPERASGGDLNEGFAFSRTLSTARSTHSRTISPTTNAPHQQTFHGRQLFLLAYQSIGVIYGDIGTSPLYVYSSTFSSPPSRANLIGVLSLVIWSLLLMVTLKYVLIILHADNGGEGGTFSCYSLLSRYANISRKDPRVEGKEGKSVEVEEGDGKVRSLLEGSRVAKGLLRLIGVLAVTMVMSDGVLTPAQSVLGAYQGLQVVVSDLDHSVITGATCGTLVVLFMVQPWGTSKIGVTFAPIVIIWLGMLAAFGIYNLVWYDAGVLRAFNPGEAFAYLIRNKTEGWHSLGGVLLAFTGVEALFADLGAFSRRAIQLSWLCWCLPCLLLAYIGQAAYIAVHPSAYAAPVFSTVPPGMLIPSLVFAILAAIVASQAIIIATFQLLSQIIKLSYFPQIRIIHTSTIYHHQLYVPLVNYLLCIGTVVIAAVYKDTTALGNAYGVCVMFVTFFDTCMTTLVALLVWKFPLYLVVIPALAFACLDGTFLSSALTKVPHGAWLTLVMAIVLASILILWRYGKENQWQAETDDRKPIEAFVRKDNDGTYRLTSSGEPLAINKGIGIFFDKRVYHTPTVFSQFISKLASTPEVVIFFHLQPVVRPTVPSDERFIVSQQFGFVPHCYRVICRHGFMDEVVTPDLGSVIYDRVLRYTIEQNRLRIASQPNTKESNDPKPTEKALTTTTTDVTLTEAYNHRVLHIIGKAEMHIRPGTHFWRRFLLHIFLFLRDNTRNKMANLKVPTDRFVQIGFVKKI